MKEVELRSEELQEVMGRIPPWIQQRGIAVLFVVVVVLLAGSAFFMYPDVIQAPIVLTGSTPPVGIVAFSSGKLELLDTQDNQLVNAGDYLAVIHNPARTDDMLYLKTFLNGLDTLLGEHAGALGNDTLGNDALLGDDTLLGNRKGLPLRMPDKKMQLGNLQSAYASFHVLLFNYNEYIRRQYYPNKIRMTKERLVQYGEQYRSLLRQQKITEEQISLIDKNHERSALMHEKGGISGKELDESRSRQLQGQMTEENMLNSINNMRIQLAQMSESLIDMEHQHSERMNDFQSQIRSMVSQLKANIQSWEMSYVLMSPVDGKITFTRYWVSNQNVQAGEEVFSVIPVSESQIIGKAMLPIARSGKVMTGQSVNIRLDNFPDNEFGMLKGVVQNISLVPTTASGATYYVVEISLSDGLHTNYKKELPFLPNMQGSADIITTNISLLERFVMPMKKIFKDGQQH